MFSTKKAPPLKRKAKIAAPTTGIISLRGTLVPYQLTSARRARAIRLTLYPDRGLVVTKGRSVRREFAEEFILEKADWILETLAHFKTFPKDITADFTPADISRYKKEALEIAHSRLAHFATHYQLTYARVGIRNQKTRWGSCSPSGVLNFNYRLALLPMHLADYLVVHELCHRAQMNHSPKFWALVAETIPEYVACRKELRHIHLTT